MSSGLIALLDDIAALAKVAAATLDDAAGQAAKASAKAAGVVIDDAAVTPRYVVGFAADRELPIIKKIALGSLRNKLVFLLPAALVLSFFAPWAITPLLMIGGLYLCFEGAEKVHELVAPHHDNHGETAAAVDAATFEDEKVAGAVRTDFILSAEIMAITLSQVATSSFWMQATVLGVVGLGITAAVYGAVALIVRADDAGVALAQSKSAVARAVGSGLVHGMPVFLKVLSLIGTLAMLWVGGGILVHGLEAYGVTQPGHLIHDIAHGAGVLLPGAAGSVLEWLVQATLSGLVGLAAGIATVPLVTFAIKPLLARFA